MAVGAQSAAPTNDASPGASGPSGDTALPSGSAPTPASSPHDSAQDVRGPDYFREAFRRVRGQTQTAAPREQPQAPQAPPAQRSARPDQERAGAAGASSARQQQQAPTTTLPERSEPAPNVLTMTPEQFQRSVQAETDRRLAKQAADERARKAREEEQYLRRNDPLEYVRRLDEAEQTQQVQAERQREAVGLLEQQLHHYDRGVLDTLVGALPEKARTSILKSVNPEGIPGRTELAKQSLKALQQYWQHQGRETARQQLLKDQTFIKEVLARYGGSPGEVDPTPALPPSAAGRHQTSNDAVNSWMRQGASQARTVSGRR